MANLYRLLVFVIAAATACAQIGTLSWQEQTRVLSASPTAFRYGFHGFGNSAMLSSLSQFDMMGVFTSRPTNSPVAGMWGLSMGLPSNLLPFAQGFGFMRSGNDSVSVTDWRYALSFGGEKRAFSVGYGWSSGDDTLFQRSEVLTLAMFTRISDYASFGFTRTQPLREFAYGSNAIELAIRPIGAYPFTLFADASFNDNTEGFKNYNTSVGAVVEPLDGFRVVGRYVDTKQFSVGVDIGLGALGIGVQHHAGSDGKAERTSYVVHLGADDRAFSFFSAPPKKIITMNMRGGMKYQRFKLFDDSATLLATLQTLQEIRTDENSGGVILNCSGMNIGDEMLWEIREQLRLIKEAGKSVVIYLDRADISDYYFASVASKVVLDPIGGMSLTGYASGRTYMKRMLDKVGVGVDELRFFKYKSAAEGYSRESMSEGEREQRTSLMRDRYELVKTGVCESRKISATTYDSIVNSFVSILPKQALALGLIDTIARFDELQGIMRSINSNVEFTSIDALPSNAELPDEHWGSKPTVAVIYAIGACSMDGGINARSLVHDVDRAVNSPSIKAIVLRVDSPGGDPLASDLIASALRKAKEKNKPVIISQGSVAGSGGYWLSMYGDEIYAAPNTITGSIGVISSMFYSKWLADSIGLNFDLVKFGKFSDIGLGPDFIGLAQLPARTYTAEERLLRETDIKDLYRDFVAKVASGRNKDTAFIHSVAQGRVYSGTEGKKLSLVDNIGGLLDAIEKAKSKAGINESVSIAEFPSAPLIDFSMFTPKLIGVTTTVESNALSTLELLKFRLQNNGKTLMLLPMEWDEEIQP